MKRDQSGYIPHEVVKRVIECGQTIVRAWREYLSIEPEIVAQRMGMTSPAYAHFETEIAPATADLARFAQAVGISPKQLDV